jgi:hypothetical protein
MSLYGNGVAVLHTVVSNDGESVAGGEPILDHLPLAVRADSGGNPCIAGMLRAES